MARLEEELISFPVYSSDDPMACGGESIINGQLALLNIFHVHPENWREMIQCDLRTCFKWVRKKHKLDDQLVHGQGLCTNVFCY